MPMSPALNRRRGIFGAAQPTPQMAEEPQKPKFFGEGGAGRTIAGVLGDALAQLGGFDPVFAPEMQRRREMASALRQQEQQRQQGLQDWVWKQRFEAEHRPPTYFGDNAGNRWSIGPDGKPALVFRDPTQKYTQQVVTDPDGSQRLVSIPIPNNVNPDGTFGNATAGGFTTPQAPVGKLKPYGGQSATPTGNFPR